MALSEYGERWLAEKNAHRVTFNGDYPTEPDDTGPADLPPEPPGDEPVLADRLLSRSALRHLPNPEPLIDNVLDQGTTALLYGSWGTAKTFIGLDWAASVATGRSWQGRTTVQRKVLYIAGEGAHGFKARLHAWESAWRNRIDDTLFQVLPQPVNLANAMQLRNLRALVDWGGFDFIVLDTLARCMVGCDENSARDGGIVVDALTQLLQSTPGQRGVVLGVHHSGKDAKTLRGSSAFESGVDTTYFTCRDEAGIITLSREKRKDGPEADRHQLRLAPIDGTGSCVVESHREAANTSRAKQLLRTYAQCFAATGCTAAQLRDVSEMKKDTYYRAVSDLVRAGVFVNTGTPQRPFYTTVDK